MNDATSPWTEARRWRDRWEIVEALPGGGQGEAFRARRKEDGREGFLKVLKAKTVRERRSRFFRDATAYESFAVEGIPDLVESNAHRHADPDFELFIVTEFVSGPTLTRWRTDQAASLGEAVAATRRLLTILRDCHAQGCVHRDVKPDNIIAVDGDISRMALLDFGLSYHGEAGKDFRTEDGQEVGNRFLRLPELSAGSALKQDPRSDLSFAAGILFYLLVGEHPDIVQDAEGRLPHQRSVALAKLQSAAGARFVRLSAFFDDAFDPAIAGRFSNAEAMLTRLDALTDDPATTGSTEEDLAAILGMFDTSAERRRVAANKVLGDAVSAIGDVFQSIRRDFGDTLALRQSNYRVDASVGMITYAWLRPGADPFLQTTCEALPIGDEIVIRLSSETVHRTSMAAPDFGEEMAAAIRAWVINKVRKVLVDPHALPVEAAHFVETPPHARLASAIDIAKATGKPILAFVYDPSQPGRGELAYCLGAFLRNRRTRDLMNATFVTALVPLSQLMEQGDALNGKSMETARWVVFDADLKAIEEAVVYANGDEGERIMHRLAERYGLMGSGNAHS